MREILFRGKRLDNGEWVYGGYCQHDKVKVCFTTDDPQTTHLIIKDGFCDFGLEPPLQGYEVIPETVGQYTGLRDCKRTEEYPEGQMIFEGDIVREHSGDVRLLCDTRKEKTHIGVVRFGRHEVPSEDPFVWGEAYGFFIEGDVFSPAISCYGDSYKFDLEIIGNIHDNPELLKGVE